jgi:hypothetical protein
MIILKRLTVTPNQKTLMNIIDESLAIFELTLCGYYNNLLDLINLKINAIIAITKRT